MKRGFAALALLGVFGVAPLPAIAQGGGDAQEGLGFARKVCSSCHAVEDTETRSPVARAPAFFAIADVPGMTETALFALLSTPHKSMPNLILTSDEIRAVSAYILSLKRL